MKVRHPYAKNEVREVPDNDVEQWLEAGWLKVGDEPGAPAKSAAGRPTRAPRARPTRTSPTRPRTT
jgi:hypothetical protein